jgi:hypothetical protein
MSQDKRSSRLVHAPESPVEVGVGMGVSVIVPVIGGVEEEVGTEEKVHVVVGSLVGDVVEVGSPVEDGFVLFEEYSPVGNGTEVGSGVGVDGVAQKADPTNVSVIV